jgi:hypothetical protein
MNAILRGTVTGRSRDALINSARSMGAIYFGVHSDRIKVLLFNEQVDEVTYARGGEQLNVVFTADAEMEVIS